MPFLRLSRDQRGYENTFLLHVAYPGARALVLYWYRSAPAVRVGRRALDEDAIRAIEEQHPEIEFDWPNILEEANALPPEVERRQERPRRKPTRPRDEAASPRGEVNGSRRDTAPQPETDAESAPRRQSAPPAHLAAQPQGASELPTAPPPQSPMQPPAAAKPSIGRDPASHDAGLAPSFTRNPLLDELVGREIAARLRSRAAEIHARIARASVDDGTRARWRARADALDPDSWTTPVAILDGVQRADALVDELRREISVTE